ncbi:MAG: tetratricopeptide repeat protein [Candidatus Zixiibacteriota bacterium]
MTKGLVVLLMSAVAVGSVAAPPKGRKLPESAYIKTAKIEFSYHTKERNANAVYMLDSLFMHYGPHSEGLYLMCLIQDDYAKTTADLKAKREPISKLVAYRDSLRIACASKEVKAKYKGDCDKASVIDSLIVLNWRNLYNDGVGQLNRIEEDLKAKESESDSTTIAFYQKKIDAQMDSCIDNMTLAVILDSTNYLPYVALGTVYEYKGDNESGVKWLTKAMVNAKERDKLASEVAYSYIRSGKYCEAAPYLRESMVNAPKDTTLVVTLYNLAACFNNCRQYDSAVAVYRELLAIAPANGDALVGMGRYYNQIGRTATDSVRAADEAKNTEAAKRWTDARNSAFDSSYVYFKRAFDASPKDVDAAGQYGLIAYIRNDFKEALAAFTRLTELEPQNAEHFTSVGDCYLNLKDWKNAAGAYEKVVALEPDNKQIWQRLADLYQQLGMKDKQALAEAKGK